MQIVIIPNWAQWVLWSAQIISALAVPILAWYAVETHRMRKATDDQNRSLVQPILALSPQEAHAVRPGVPWIKLTNVGRGPAYRVSFEERHYDLPTPGGNLRVSVREVSSIGV